MTKEEIKEFYESQIETWDLAAKNINALKAVERKTFRIGELEGIIQFNPARAVSTLVNTDKEAIMKRKCFLCEKSRNPQQKNIEILPGWDLLVNPFPILPYHFTIVSRSHVPQKFNSDIGIQLAHRLPGMVVFFNGDGAGASAPDHWHYQAVPLIELPLIRLLDKDWNSNRKSIDLPFSIISSIEIIDKNNFPINAFFWITENGEERFIAIARKNHRPKEYFLDPPLRRAVSPGAIDMAGVIVTPFLEDFLLLNSEDVRNIYNQVSFSE